MGKGYLKDLVLISGRVCNLLLSLVCQGEQRQVPQFHGGMHMTIRRVRPLSLIHVELLQPMESSSKKFSFQETKPETLLRSLQDDLGQDECRCMRGLHRLELITACPST